MSEMDRRTFLRSAAGSAAAMAFPSVLSAAGNDGGRPNIVIIMTDDMGFSDLGCYGGDIRTPHIDGLAQRGLRFTHFYNAARCCPTRASLMTGAYQHKVGLKRNGRSLRRNCVTVAEALGAEGYQTAMAGKWHLSKTPRLKPPERHQKWIDHRIQLDRPFGPLHTYPVNRGFDRHYGVIWGVVDYFDPFSLVEGTEPVPNVPEDYYITDAITEHSVRYIREMAQKDEPFFLYTAHCAPHWPLHARQEDIERYRGKFTEGWHALRRRRYERQVEMGLIDPDTHPLPDLMGHGEDWPELSDEEKAFQAARMQAHAAMVDRVDQGVGRIVAALKQAGCYENTVIFVLSDNGASPEEPSDWGPGYDRSSQTRDGRKIHYHGLTPPGPETTYRGVGPYWANAANTPFRYWKKESFEGGAHTPFIVHWPHGLRTQPGTCTDQMGHVMDVMPTCLDLAGAKYPERFKGHAITSLDGKSLLPILKDKKRDGHDMLFFEHVGGKAVVDGEWKLVQPTRGKRWRLYHLATDRTETRDLADKHPERVRKMKRSWHEWAARVRAE